MRDVEIPGLAETIRLEWTEIAKAPVKVHTVRAPGSHFQARCPADLTLALDEVAVSYRIKMRPK